VSLLSPGELNHKPHFFSRMQKRLHFSLKNPPFGSASRDYKSWLLNYKGWSVEVTMTFQLDLHP